MPKAFRTVLNKMPERRVHNKRLNGRSAASAATSRAEDSSNTVTLSDETHAELVNATARAVLSVDRSSAPPTTVQMPRMGAGNRRQAAAASRANANNNTADASVVSEISQHRWDRDGNLL